jgi:hypothetical protein
MQQALRQFRALPPCSDEYNSTWTDICLFAAAETMRDEAGNRRVTEVNMVIKNSQALGSKHLGPVVT